MNNREIPPEKNFRNGLYDVHYHSHVAVSRSDRRMTHVVIYGLIPEYTNLVDNHISEIDVCDFTCTNKI